MEGTVTDSITAWATVGLGVVTVVVVVIAVKALRLSDRDAQEAVKSRIDQRAPLVVIIAKEPGGSIASWPTNGGDIVELQNGDDLEAEQKIGITGWFELKNEGVSTGIVGLPASVLDFPVSRGTSGLNAIDKQRPAEQHQIILRPGDERLIFVCGDRTVAEWMEVAVVAPARPRPVVVQISVEATFQAGIEDATDLHLFGIPISVRDREWVGGATTPTRLVVVRTRRQYPGLPTKGAGA